MKSKWVYGGLITVLVVVAGLMYVQETKDVTTVVALEAEDVASASKHIEETQPSIVVYVTGAVVNPDIYTVIEGSRLHEVIDIAGGFLPDASKDYLNLARFVFDGEMIYVPQMEELASDDSKTMNNLPVKVSINRADLEDLMTLTGIGQSKAEAIIEFREMNGPFQKPEDIMKVDGIKEGMYEKIKGDISI